MLGVMIFSEFYHWIYVPADLISQVGEKSTNLSFILMLWYLHFIRLCLHFLGWTISQRYWTGIRDSYPICSLFTHRHCNWWSDWYSGALSSLGQRGLPSKSPRGEAPLSKTCSAIPPFATMTSTSALHPPNFLLSLFSSVFFSYVNFIIKYLSLLIINSIQSH